MSYIIEIEVIKVGKVELVNLTPHEIVVYHGENGEVKAIPPSGLVARVATKSEQVDEVNDIPIVKTIFGDVVVVDEGKETIFNMHELTNKCNNCKDNGLCDIPHRYHSVSDCEFQKPKKVFIVSSMVAQALSTENRNDIVAPDTSPQGAIRNKDNQIIGVKRFQRW